MTEQLKTTNHLWRYFLRALLSALVSLLLFVGAHAAELRKFRLGYSTVGPAGTGLWMAKSRGQACVLTIRPLKLDPEHRVNTHACPVGFNTDLQEQRSSSTSLVISSQ